MRGGAELPVLSNRPAISHYRIVSICGCAVSLFNLLSIGAVASGRDRRLAGGCGRPWVDCGVVEGGFQLGLVRDMRAGAATGTPPVPTSLDCLWGQVPLPLVRPDAVATCDGGTVSYRSRGRLLPWPAFAKQRTHLLVLCGMCCRGVQVSREP
jgi:hypothetical protein